MFKIFTKRFWQLCAKRKKILSAIRSIPGKTFWIYKGEDYRRCHLCKETTYEIAVPVIETSLAGEQFVFRSHAVAYFCARCETVSCYSDVSSHDMTVWDWIKRPVNLQGRRYCLGTKEFKAEPL